MALGTLQTEEAFLDYSSREHNRQYFPRNINGISFDLKVTDASQDDELQFFIGADRVGNAMPLQTVSGTLVHISIPCAAYAGTVHTLKFMLSSPDGLLGIDSQVQVDNVQFETDVSPPKVIGVFVNGTNWSSSFLDAVRSTAEVDGYAIATGSGDQLKTLPWVNINQIKIMFDKRVDLQSGDLTLSGISVPNYAFSTFAFDTATFVGTWTLSSPLGADRLTLGLSDSVTDIVGNRLDGEWIDERSASQSGDGVEGGAFLFGLNILPGDVNRNGVITGGDVNTTKVRVGAILDAVNCFSDLNGNGLITGADINLIKTKIGALLP